jgi:multimeric flavodoxin WrbA
LSIEILGISGSPVPNSNTDRLVLQVLKASGATYKFVKLSQVNVGPCQACKACVEDKLCKVKDGFPEIAKLLQEAKGLVLGGNTLYGGPDAFTKTFLERLCALRHLNSLNAQKYIVTIISGANKENSKLALKLIAQELLRVNMNPIAQLNSEEHAPEDPAIWEKARQSGELLGQLVTEEIECWLDYE